MNCHSPNASSTRKPKIRDDMRQLVSKLDDNSIESDSEMSTGCRRRKVSDSDDEDNSKVAEKCNRNKQTKESSSSYQQMPLSPTSRTDSQSGGNPSQTTLSFPQLVSTIFL